MQAESTFISPAAPAREATPRWLETSGWHVLLAALGLGFAGDVLFYKQSLGLNAALFAALILAAAILVYARARAARVTRHNLWLAAPILFFGTMIFLRDEPALTVLNLGATLLLIGVLAVTLGTSPLERLTVLAYPLGVAVGAIQMAFGGFPLAGFAAERLNARGGGANVAGRVAVGLLLALPVLLVFGALFSSADAVFAQVMRDWIRIEFLRDLIWQAVFITLLTWFCGGALLMSLGRAHAEKPAPDLETPLKSAVQLGVVESATVLAAVGALFALFVGIQFTYFFGGNANIRIDGFTYAEYARRGFFEMVLVAVLTMGLLQGLDWLTLRTTARARGWFKGLCLTLIALVLVVLTSAFLRMSLYESAYGFTSLRLYTHWFMVWMGAVFVLKAGELAFERRALFAFGSFLSLIVALAGFNLLNPDATIAEQNLRRYTETGKIDTAYAAAMSADAAPVLAAGLASLRGTEREQLGGALRVTLDRLYERTEKAGWQSWHLARKQAVDALVERRDTLYQFAPWNPPRYRFD